MKPGRWMVLVATAGALWLVSAASVMAQTQPSTAAPSADNQDQLLEVIVTAERRSEDLQKTPVAISAISGDEIAREVVHSTSDLQGIAPGAIFISDTQIAVRGISNNAIQATGVSNDNSVSIFVDGLVNPRGSPGLLYDLQRVEVLRGPQGTLYGRNNTAGALNIINNRPTDEFYGSVTAEVGDYSRFSTEGMLNLPVSDVLQLRTSFSTIRHDAYQSDGFDTQDSVAGRLRVQYEPTDKVTVLLGGDYEEDRGVPATSAFYPPGAANPKGLAWEPWDGTPVCPNGIYVPHSNCTGADERSDTRTTGAIGELDWDLGLANLTYLGGVHDTQATSFGYGGSGTNIMINDGRDQWMSHELRVSNATDSAIKWVAGAYYYFEDDTSKGAQYPPPGPPGPLAYGDMSIGPSNSDSRAVFAQTTIPVVEHVRLTGGVRYTVDTKVQTQYNYDVPEFADGPPAGTVIYNLRYHKSNVSYKVGAEADLSDNILGYANYSTGYKAGGFNSVFGQTSFLPEQIKAYQAGLKSRFLDNRLQFNVDGFYYDYSDFQVQTIAPAQTLPPPAPLNPFSLITLNAQLAHFYGGEIELIGLVTPDDLVQVNLSLLDATLTQFVIPSNPITGNGNLSGTPDPFAPKESGRLTYRHTFNLGDRGRVEAQVQEDISNGYWIQINHDPGSYQKSFDRTGVDITYIAPKDRWRLSLWGRNLENYATIQGFLFSTGPGVPPSAIISSEPRTYGVRLTANF